MSAAVDLDRFYSTPPIAQWRQVLGPGLHYHNGFFSTARDLEGAQRQTVENFYPHIPPGCAVLDGGCGWGGPASMLAQERGCAVTGITISDAQAKYCRQLGLDVRLGDLEDDPLTGSFDVAFLLEVLSHVRAKRELVSRLRDRVETLILSVNCVADGSSGSRETFDGSMILCTPTELQGLVTQAGWTIQSMRDRRTEALPTLVHWQRNLKAAYGESRPPGQLGVLRDMTEHALRNIGAWARNHPLIDIVAV